VWVEAYRDAVVLLGAGLKMLGLRRKHILLTAMGAGSLVWSYAQAADKWWDTTNASGLTPGNGNWEDSNGSPARRWAISASPGTANPVKWDNGDNAIFQASGISLVSVTGAVTAGTIAITGTGYTISGTSGITLTGANITTAAAGTINAPIVGSGGLTKLGSAALTLGGQNTYTGVTNVDAGLLLVNNATGVGISASSAVNVNSGGTLGGTGTISSATTVHSGGKLAPGSSSIATLNLNNDISLTSSSTFVVEVGATADRVFVRGTGSVFTVGGATLQILPLDGINTTTTYTIVSTAGDTGNSVDFSSFFAGLSNGVQTTQGNLTYTVTATSTAITVSFATVHEPTSLAIFPVAASALLRRRRRG
jgi:autotransporter-associated beta strand protein